MENLAQLGRIAGIGGIAVGVALLVLQPLIKDAVPILEPAARGQAVLVIAVGALALGALGIFAWIVGRRSRPQPTVVVTADRGSNAAGRDVHISGGPLPAASAKPRH